MADPVKISELPNLTTVNANDILPIVDAALTQTSKCTASQIALLGGGPPGDGTVTTAKMANGAVTAAKTSFAATDRLLGRAAAGAGAGEEVPCTSYARGFLAVANAAGARTYLDALQSTASPTFTGTVQVNGDLNVTGQVNNTNYLSLAAGGNERMRLLANGHIGTPIPANDISAADFPNSPTALYPAFHCRAWVNFTASGGVVGVVGSGNVLSVTRNSLGSYTVTFVKALPDAKYAVTQSHSPTPVLDYLGLIGSFLVHSVFSINPITQSSVSILFHGPFDSTNRVDVARSMISIFR